MSPQHPQHPPRVRPGATHIVLLTDTNTQRSACSPLLPAPGRKRTGDTGGRGRPRPLQPHGGSTQPDSPGNRDKEGLESNVKFKYLNEQDTSFNYWNETLFITKITKILWAWAKICQTEERDSYRELSGGLCRKTKDNYFHQWIETPNLNW